MYATEPSRSTTSLTLLDGVKRSDQQSWDTFVTIYAPVVLYWAKQKGLQPSDCEDLVQDVFISVSRSIERFTARPNRVSFRPWLRTVFRRRFADWLRAQRGELACSPEVLEDLAALEVCDDDPDPERSQVIALRAAMGLIQHWDSFPVAMAVLEGRSIQDVADETGKSPESVKQAVYRVRRKLAELIETPGI